MIQICRKLSSNKKFSSKLLKAFFLTKFISLQILKHFLHFNKVCHSNTVTSGVLVCSRVSRNPHRFSLGGGRFKWSGGVVVSSGQRPFLLSRLRVWYLVLPSNGGSPWVCFGGSNFFLFQITLSRRFEKSRFQGPLLHSVQNGTLSLLRWRGTILMTTQPSVLWCGSRWRGDSASAMWLPSAVQCRSTVVGWVEPVSRS